MSNTGKLKPFVTKTQKIYTNEVTNRQKSKGVKNDDRDGRHCEEVDKMHQ